MRIGHYAPLISAKGGIATYIRRLGAAQAEAGHSIYYLSRAPVPEGTSAAYVCVNDDRALFDRTRELGLDILHLHKPVHHLPQDRLPTVRTMHGNQGSCPSGSRYLARSGRPCNRSYSVPGCLWGHLVDHCGSRRPRKIQADFESIRLEMRQALELHTIAVSQYLKDQMVRSGCPEDRLHVLPSASPEVDVPFVAPPHDGVPRFVFLGRLVPQKGAQWLLHAVRDVMTDIRVDIAGDGDSLEELQYTANQLGIADRVTFHGWLPPESVARLIQDARAVIVPSVWNEPAGLATLEAAAYGRPVIASAVGGIPEYAHPDFALLIPPNDVAELAACITRLSRDHALAERLGRKGRDLARSRFSMGKFMHELEKFYALVMQEHCISAACR